MSGQRSGEFRSQPLPELYPSARGACVQEPPPRESSRNFDEFHPLLPRPRAKSLNIGKQRIRHSHTYLTQLRIILI